MCFSCHFHLCYFNIVPWFCWNLSALTSLINASNDFPLYLFICLSFRVKVDLDIVKKARVVDDVSSDASVQPFWGFGVTIVLQQAWEFSYYIVSLWKISSVILLACDTAGPMCLRVICSDFFLLSCQLIRAQRNQPDEKNVCFNVCFLQTVVQSEGRPIWQRSPPAGVALSAVLCWQTKWGESTARSNGVQRIHISPVRSRALWSDVDKVKELFWYCYAIKQSHSWSIAHSSSACYQ